MKKCYYEQLGVERNATSEEIKTAFRKKALQVHPDKNPSPEAKEQFQALNEAYNVLSDPNERTWYDNHRQQILSPDSSSPEDQEFGLHIWAYFSTNCFTGFGDDPAGFFAVYRDLFEKIKDLERLAWENAEENGEESPEEYRKMPGFGDSKTSYEKVGEFYESWENFSTNQSFAYADIYKWNDAENRQIRRLLEKENKKERNKEKKNYIKVIKALVDFVRKRDPRYKEYTRILQEEEEKRRDAKKKAEENAKLLKKEQRRQALEEEIKRYQEENTEIGGEEERKDLEAREFYCEICDKEFKTENQLINHSQSKIHVKNVKELMEEVAFKEEKEAFQENCAGKSQKNQGNQENRKKNKKNKKKRAKNQEKAASLQAKAEENGENSEENQENIEESKENIEQKIEEKPSKIEEKPSKTPESEEDSDEELNFHGFGRQKFEKVHEKSEFFKENAENPEKPEILEEESKELPENSENTEKSSINKAKLRKLKKKQRETAQTQENKLICNVCEEAFATKNQLFKHLKAKGHEMRK